MKENLELIKQKLLKIRINYKIRYQFFLFLLNINISDRKIKTFLNFDDNRKSVAFLYKLVVYNAYKYGIPNVYIKECLKSKKEYEYLKSRTPENKKYEIYAKKTIMMNNYNNLLIAVNEAIKIKNSRKHKIVSLLEKISDINN